MTAKVIVFLENTGDQRFGEVSVLDSAGEAAHLVETLLEAGCDPNRIRIFAGAEMEARVSLRPVVDLVRGDQEARDGAPRDPAVESEASAGERPEPEPEPAQRRNGFLAGEAPGRLVEMMPEMFH